MRTFASSGADVRFLLTQTFASENANVCIPGRERSRPATGPVRAFARGLGREMSVHDILDLTLYKIAFIRKFNQLFITLAIAIGDEVVVASRGKFIHQTINFFLSDAIF